MYQTLLHATNLIYMGFVCSTAASEFNNMWQFIYAGKFNLLVIIITLAGSRWD